MCIRQSILVLGGVLSCLRSDGGSQFPGQKLRENLYRTLYMYFSDSFSSEKQLVCRCSGPLSRVSLARVQDGTCPCANPRITRLSNERHQSEASYIHTYNSCEVSLQRTSSSPTKTSIKTIRPVVLAETLLLLI